MVCQRCTKEVPDNRYRFEFHDRGVDTEKLLCHECMMSLISWYFAFSYQGQIPIEKKLIYTELVEENKRRMNEN